MACLPTGTLPQGTNDESLGFVLFQTVLGGGNPRQGFLHSKIHILDKGYRNTEKHIPSRLIFDERFSSKTIFVPISRLIACSL